MRIEFCISRCWGRGGGGRGVASVAHIITGHEQTRLTESAIFIYFVYSLFPKDLTIQNLLIWYILLFQKLWWLCTSMHSNSIERYLADFAFIGKKC